MNTEIDYSLLPECCNSGCTVCVLDYPELFLSTIDENTAALITAVEQAEQSAIEIEEIQWTNKEKMN